MIDTGTKLFLCDECPICKGIAYRMQLAKEGGYDPQLEYCWCDKIQTEFYLSGFCEDAFKKKSQYKKKGRRNNGFAYRREMKHKHQKKLIWIIHNCGYNPAAGYLDWDWVDGIWQPVGKYIKYPKNSNSQRFWKRHSNKIVRKKKTLFQGNQYRKCFDYWWTMF